MMIECPMYTLTILAVLFIASAIKIPREYERGVVFLLRRFWRMKGLISSSLSRVYNKW